MNDCCFLVLAWQWDLAKMSSSEFCECTLSCCWATSLIGPKAPVIFMLFDFMVLSSREDCLDGELELLANLS